MDALNLSSGMGKRGPAAVAEAAAATAAAPGAATALPGPLCTQAPGRTRPPRRFSHQRSASLARVLGERRAPALTCCPAGLLPAKAPARPGALAPAVLGPPSGRPAAMSRWSPRRLRAAPRAPAPAASSRPPRPPRTAHELTRWPVQSWPARAPLLRLLSERPARAHWLGRVLSSPFRRPRLPPSFLLCPPNPGEPRPSPAEEGRPRVRRAELAVGRAWAGPESRNPALRLWSLGAPTGRVAPALAAARVSGWRGGGPPGRGPQAPEDTAHSRLPLPHPAAQLRSTASARRAALSSSRVGVGCHSSRAWPRGRNGAAGSPVQVHPVKALHRPRGSWRGDPQYPSPAVRSPNGVALNF
ncbi:translation initiation factor IF-2-like [Alexandromys fortis]|uniref:translation initiation factor IF-2-like n=1 Tax=Alexandromys fortis TaxID=100897 RepID=UPI002152A805|nr:translation initiation factor IF-2-like [Microtus fortis]